MVPSLLLMFSLVQEVICLVTEGTLQEMGDTYLKTGCLQSKYRSWFQFLILS